jgi:imidazole glycerol phosphate synthase glutamine amidotransferase subunit
MAMPEVLVVRTGTANMASVLAGLRRAGAAPRVSVDPAEVENALSLVLPGVGAFAAAMKQLEDDHLTEPLRRRVDAGRATLSICLGLQVLADASEENPGVRGLGVIRQTVRRFPDTVRVPQLGWNLVHPDANCRLLEEGHAYFANSYRLVEPPRGWYSAMSDHGGPFVAAIEHGAVLACQFHPELSGEWGLALLKRWLIASTEEPC